MDESIHVWCCGFRSLDFNGSWLHGFTSIQLEPHLRGCVSNLLKDAQLNVVIQLTREEDLWANFDGMAVVVRDECSARVVISCLMITYDRLTVWAL